LLHSEASNQITVYNTSLIRVENLVKNGEIYKQELIAKWRSILVLPKISKNYEEKL